MTQTGRLALKLKTSFCFTATLYLQNLTFLKKARALFIAIVFIDSLKFDFELIAALKYTLEQ